MSNTKTLGLVVIVIVFLGVALVPIVTPAPKELYRAWIDSDLDEGYFRFKEIECDIGWVIITYQSNILFRNVGLIKYLIPIQNIM